MMIFHHHHRSFFLPILALLTAGLVVFMFYSLTDSNEVEKFTEEITSPVSSQEYTNSVKSIGKKFVESYEVAENDMAKLVLVENTISELLALRVPSEFKETHLELAVYLSQMQTELRSQKDTAETFNRFTEILRPLASE
jgi:hypothetical protein